MVRNPMSARSLFAPLLAVLAVDIVAAPTESRAAETAHGAQAKGKGLVVSPRLQELDPQNNNGNLWKLLVLSRPRGQSYHGTPPPDDTLKRMFVPVPDSNRPQDGGLGISPARLMREADWHLWSPPRTARPTTPARNRAAPTRGLRCTPSHRRWDPRVPW
jgi:hypothetical protein